MYIHLLYLVHVGVTMVAVLVSFMIFLPCVSPHSWFKYFKNICLVCVYMGKGHGCGILRMWKLEENLKELVLTFHHVECKDGTQTSVSNKLLYLLIHLANLQEPL